VKLGKEIRDHSEYIEEFLGELIKYSNILETEILVYSHQRKKKIEKI